MKIRIVILNYNGELLLDECLPSILEAARRSQHEVTVAVIDNRSTDHSVEFLRRRFPEAEVYVAPENRVLCSYNEYLARVPEPVVILLNNDIRVHPDFVDPLVDSFETDPTVFMVTPKCLSFDGIRYEGGRSRNRIKFGLFWNASIFKGYEPGIGQTGFTMAAGFGAFERSKFMALGGYDDLYLPGRLEDTDICFRAWRRGWKCFYEPRSVVYHRGAASFHSKFGASKTLALGHRNSFLFFWKNISDPGYWAEHVLLLAPRLFFAALSGKLEMVKGFFAALPRLGAAWRKRKISMRESRIQSDREIFAKV
ncbi:MAG: glycosyltransferase [Candidatus Omnitrophica bacterium]|nr:glycosyltransferase [Candidatus Omnitrophota bacterium]